MLMFLLRATGLAALAAGVAVICASLMLSYHTLRLVLIAAFPTGLYEGHRWKGALTPDDEILITDEDLEERTALAIAI